MDQQPDLRYLCLAVKRWSKLTGLNTATSPDGGGLTSYGFHLLLVYYALRRRLVAYVAPESIQWGDIAPVPAALPLRFPGDADGADAWRGRSLGERIAQDDASAARVGEWALDFVRFYLHEFDYERDVASLSRGAAAAGLVTTEALQWTRQEEYAARGRGEYLFYRFCIEDPYEINLNVGRHMSSVKLMIFKKHLEKALETGLAFIPADEKAKQRVKPKGRSSSAPL
ncbi:poly(A) polymerase [Strigomonas culicis]|uniref:RNA uridylyltransferase n=1 Tax=Strigomonas culicis TaxID=28005 RepID=S9UU24_9TRYP|nr:poly(A) polymerase [Strigomonas culicis]|eukprot:EPY34442.1 poly(A) polymerase [Strigomonas culicis]